HPYDSLKIWFEKRPSGSAAEARGPTLPFNTLKTSHKFKGTCYYHCS
ncbi:unnamed protein product, partial [Rotaria sp. Silwood2]